MRRVVVGVAVVLALGLLAWFLWPKGGSAPGSVGDGTDVEDGGDAPEGVGGTGPTLGQGGGPARGTGSKGAKGSAPVGRSAIVGTVRRGTTPTAAKVELRYLMDADDASLFRRGGAAFFERLLAPPPSASAAGATVEAGDDGRFAFEGISAGVWSVTAVAPDGARGSATATVLVEGARVEANPVVAAGSESLRGRVVRSDGSAFRGVVSVTSGAGGQGLESALFQGSEGVAYSLDESGRFVASGLAAGSVMVHAIDPGVARTTGRPITIPYEGEYVLTVDAAFAAVEGKVVSDADGSPVAGAEVLGGGQGAETTFAIARTTTDAEGAFRLSLPVGRESGILARAPGFAPQVVQRREVDPKAPVEIRLVKGARLVGRVASDGDGKPAEGVTVRAMASRGGDNPFPPEPATSGADGRYELVDLPGGEVTVVAQGAGWVAKGLGELRGGFNPLAVALVAGQTTTFDVVVVRGARAQGKVVDPAGQPVAGAVVSADGSGEGGFRSGRVFGTAGGDPTASGSDGAFALESLVPGATFSLSATAPGFAKGSAGPFVATDAAPVVTDIRLAAARRVEVSVLDEGSGSPIPGARVVAQVENASGGWTGDPGGTGFTGADGKASLGPLAEGRLRVTAEADGYVRDVDPKPFAATESALVIRLRRGLVIAGRVRNADGTPAVGVRVSLESGGRRWWIGSETSGADGAFRFRGIPEGSYTVRVTAGDGRNVGASATAEAGREDVSLTLTAQGAAEAGEILVRVVDPQGKPVPRAQIRLETDGGSWGTSVRDGVARLGGGTRSPGAVVRVWGATARDGTPLPVAPGRASVPTATTTEMEIRLLPEAAIGGTVLGPDGRGVRGALVSAFLPKPQREGRGDYPDYEAIGSGRSGDDGAYRVGGLADEEYVLRVQAPSGLLPPEDVRANGGSAGVDLRLRAGAEAAVTVLDPEGKPVAGATVTAEREGRGGSPTRTDGAGVARLGSLDPQAAYTLRIQLPPRREDLRAPSAREGWKPRDEVVRLERGYTVKGIVRDQTGKPVAGASVQRVDEQGRSVSGGDARSGDDGTFTMTGLPAGSVSLRASASQGMIWRSNPTAPPSVTVAAGSENVVLTVDVGLELNVLVENSAERWLNSILAIEGGPGQAHANSSDGKFRYRGLRADETYSLWIGPTEDGKSYWATGVRGGQDLRVRLVQGKTITVRVIAPPDTKNVGLSIEGSGPRGGSKPLGENRFELRGIPDGTWKVVAGGQVGDVWWRGDVQAAAGASVEITLRPPNR